MNRLLNFSQQLSKTQEASDMVRLVSMKLRAHSEWLSAVKTWVTVLQHHIKKHFLQEHWIQSEILNIVSHQW